MATHNTQRRTNSDSFAALAAIRRAASEYLERQADASFEIATVIADPYVASELDDFVAELRLDATWKFPADLRAGG